MNGMTPRASKELKLGASRAPLLETPRGCTLIFLDNYISVYEYAKFDAMA